MKLIMLLNLALCQFVLHFVRIEACITGQVDFLFILDSSSNVGADNFNLELRVASNLAENLAIGPDAVQIGAMTFADSFHNLFDFNSYADFIQIDKALIHAQYLSGSSNTSAALENSRNFFTANHGARRNASRVAILFTDGRSSDPVRTRQQAAYLKKAHVYVIAVGLANSNTQELLAIASGPEGVLHINNFNGILYALQIIRNNSCSFGVCVKGQLDVLYVLDSSSTVGAANFEHGFGLAANLAENFRIGGDSVQYAALTFANNSHHMFNFTTFTNYIDLKKALLASTYLTGSTNTFLALEDAQSFFYGSHGDRMWAPDVAVVITNGMSSDPVRTAQQALMLKQLGVYVIVVGYPGAKRQELETIASQPSSVFDINNFNGVLKALQDYNNNACDQIF